MNKQRQTIAIDIDDVLAGSTEALRLSVNTAFGVDLQPEHYKIPGKYRGYYTNVFQKNGIVDNGILQDFHTTIIEDTVTIHPIENAVVAIKELSRSYNIVFITAREKAMENTTRKWFKEHFGHSSIELYFVNSYHESKTKTKGELCVELGAELLIDDSPDHCQSAIDNGVEAILFGEYGWHINTPKNVVRCKDWQSVLEYLHGR